MGTKMPVDQTIQIKIANPGNGAGDGGLTSLLIIIAIFGGILLISGVAIKD